MIIIRAIALICAIIAIVFVLRGRTTAVAREPGSAVTSGTPADSPVAQNTLTASERAAGWRLLFDGKTFNGWRGLGYDSVPTAHWKIEHGTIRKLADGQVPRL